MVIDFAQYTPGTKNNAVADAAGNLNPQNEIMLLDETKVPGIKTVKLELHRSDSTWKVDNTTWDDIVASGYKTVVANPQPDEVQTWEITKRLGRVVPPDPHPPGGLQDPLAERQGALQRRARHDASVSEWAPTPPTTTR